MVSGRNIGSIRILVNKKLLVKIIETEIIKLGLRPIDEKWHEAVERDWFARYYTNEKDIVLVTVAFVTGGAALVEVLNRVAKFRVTE